MRNLIALASLLVLGCSTPSASNVTADTSIKMCQSADGTICAGVPGMTGDKGDPGTPGTQGPAGTPGDQGPTGPIGPAGVQGPQGPMGLTGAQGVQGLQGPQGTAGATGAQGPKGDQGIQGVQGAQGPAGVAGPAGKQAWVSGTVGGVQKIFGTLVPTFTGKPAVYMSDPSGTIANFPNDYILSSVPVTLYYPNTTCSGSGSWVAASDVSFTNQLFSNGPGNVLMQLTVATESPTNLTPLGRRDPGGACGSSAPAGSYYSITTSPYTFSIGTTQPWTISLQ